MAVNTFFKEYLSIYISDYFECMCAQHIQFFCDPMDCSQPGFSVMGFSRQNWSGLPFPSPGDLPDPGIKPKSPAVWVDSSPLSHLGSPSLYVIVTKNSVCPFERQHFVTFR